MIAIRQKGRFAGFSLYVSNISDVTNIRTGFLCYKDELDLPTLDFSKTCTVHGRYVIYYNERLAEKVYPVNYETGNVITDLCEVTVTGK